MKCFYHGDADGITAGFWVSYFTKNTNANDYIEINYDKVFPFDLIGKDEEVYIVDYSIPPTEMEKLLGITNNVIWIDHHKTAIEKYKDFTREIKGLRYDGVAGCVLTWMWFKGYIEPSAELECEVPTFTRYIGDYDVWAFRYGVDTKWFHTAFNAKNYTPTDPRMKNLLFSYTVEQMCLDGGVMESYKNGWSKDYCKAFGFERDFEGHAAYVLNLGLAGADSFAGIDVDKYDLLISCVYDGQKWKYSLRSSKIDVSEIAKKYGGGGHRGAAGFISEEFLFS